MLLLKAGEMKGHENSEQELKEKGECLKKKHRDAHRELPFSGNAALHDEKQDTWPSTVIPSCKPSRY